MPEQITVKLLYFARLGEELGCSSEQLQIASGSSLHDLVEHLCARNANWQRLRDPEIRCAINQTLCKENLNLHNGDEIAFFPPVTGG